MLERQSYFVREHVGLLKLTDTYDILDPESQEQIGIAKEKVGGLIKTLRFIISKQLMPTTVYVYEGGDPDDNDRLLFSIHRGVAFFRTKVEVKDGSDKLIGWFKSKAFSIGGSFRVFSAAGDEVALVKGNWKGWTFKFVDKDDQELGTITKKWTGIGKELFTSADNYMISLNGDPSPGTSALLLAAGLAIDTVYKEK